MKAHVLLMRLQEMIDQDPQAEAYEIVIQDGSATNRLQNKVVMDGHSKQIKLKLSRFG